MIVSLGTDTSYDDPLGSFELLVDRFSKIGEHVATVKLPSLVVQKGGYNLDSIDQCVLNFLSSLESHHNSDLTP